jgi:hypothetical protein
MGRSKAANDKIIMEVNLIKSKLKAMLEKGMVPTLRENCKIEDDVMWMQCKRCEEWFERTTEFFGTSGKKMNFEECAVGEEFLYNSYGDPCKKCCNKMQNERIENPQSFVHSLVHNHIKTGFTEKLFYELYEKQQKKGLISGLPLLLERASVGMYCHDSFIGHAPGNVYLELQELKIRHDGEDMEHVPNVWTKIYTELHKQFETNFKTNDDHLPLIQSQYFVKPKHIGLNTSDVNQYFKIRSKIHFSTIIRNAIHRHIDGDIKSHRFTLPIGVTKSQFVYMVRSKAIKKLEQQNWRCGYTNIAMTIESAWTQFSFERIDNDESHFTQTGDVDNIVFICRIFNTFEQLSMERILTFFLHQNLLPISDQVRSNVENKLAQIRIETNGGPMLKKRKI